MHQIMKVLVNIASGIIAVVLPWFVFQGRTVDFLSTVSHMIGPMFWPLIFTVPLCVACAAISICQIGRQPRYAVNCSEQALDMANICLWFGFIGTYLSLTQAVLAGNFSAQLIGEAMTSTLIGAVAIALAGCLRWLVRLLTGIGGTSDAH